MNHIVEGMLMYEDDETLSAQVDQLLKRSRFSDAEALCREYLAKNENSAKIWASLAMTLMSQGLPFESIDCWEQSLKLDDSEPFNWANYGAALSMLRRNDEAEAALKKSLDIDSENTSRSGTWYNLGNIYLNSKRHKLAEEAFKKAIEGDSSRQMYWANLGAALTHQGSVAEAADAYEQSIRINPSYVIGWEGLAKSLKKLNQFEKAADAFQKYLELAPGDGLMWNEYGLTLHNLGREEEELLAYRKATEFVPNDPWPWNNLGIILLGRREYAEAEMAFRKATELDPTQKPFWAGLHTVLMESGKRGEEAQRAKLKAAEITVRDDKDGLKTIDVEGEMLENMTKSLATMQQSLDDAYHLLSQGKIDEAEEKFNDLLSNYPESPELKLPYADVLIARGKYNEALEIAEEAINANQKIGLPWFTRGRALAGIGKMNEADKSMRRGIEIEPGNRWLKIMYEEWVKMNKTKPSEKFDHETGTFVSKQE